jgi:ribose transport system permease protein
MDKLKKAYQKMMSYEVILILIILVAFIAFTLAAPGFFNIRNVFVLLRSMSLIAIVGTGVTFVITTGEIDLSIASLPSLCAVIVAVMIKASIPIPLAILTALIVAAAFGLLNALLVADIGLPSIIATLATSMIAKGSAYVVGDNTTIVISNTYFLNMFGKNIGTFPRVFIWMAAFSIIAFMILNKLKAGRELAYIGDNKIAAKYSGINSRKGLYMAFLLCALFCLVAGLCGAAQASNATAYMFDPTMMTAFSATFIGGTVMSGGKGSIIGTVLGAFLLAVLENGLLIVGLDQWVLYLINGIIITLSVMLGSKVQNTLEEIRV